jgi:hypothetical protein
MSMLRKVIYRSSRLTLIIDALDRCVEAQTLLRYLKDARQHQEAANPDIHVPEY